MLINSHFTPVYREKEIAKRGGGARKNFGHSFARSRGWKLSALLNGEPHASSGALGKRKKGKSRTKVRKKREFRFELWILYACGAKAGEAVTRGERANGCESEK